MSDLHEQVEYWKNGYKQDLDELYEILTQDFECMKVSGETPSEITTEKPDFISDSIWEHLFIKTNLSYSKLKSRYIEERVHMSYLSINGVKIGCLRNCRSVFFIFDEDVSLEHDEDQSTEYIVYKRYRETNFNNINGDRLTTIVNVFSEFYGEENICFSSPASANFRFMRMGYGNGLILVINHGRFWCHDNYGLGFEIQGGMSAIHLRCNGKFRTSSPFYFTVYKKDSLLYGQDLAHPHCTSVSYPDKMRFKKICTGSNSPINSAIAACSDRITEESVYNLILNYDNLLSKEDEDGVPHRRMRKYLLVRGDSENMQTIDLQRLFTHIKREELAFTVNLEENKFSINISSGNINDLMNNLYRGNSITFYDVVKERYYRKELNSRGRDIGDHYGTIYFNGEYLDVEKLPHDPQRFDISGMSDDLPLWNQMGGITPSEDDIEDATRIMELIINTKFISETNVNKIESEEINEELIGLNEIGRRTNIDNIL